MEYHPLKVKRKNLEQFNDDFSDFSLSSPATKIRRLDVDLPPIIEEEEVDVPIAEQPVAEQSFGDNAGLVGGGLGGRGIVIEELPSEPVNEERAIVPFKPINSPLVTSPSDYSITVDPRLISGFKSQVWSNESNRFKDAAYEENQRDRNSGPRNDSLAVVPWVPSQQPSAAGYDVPSQTDPLDMMDAEEMETTTMDVEDNVCNGQGSVTEASGMNLNEGIHQWQQQHCMIPQPPQNTSTPLVWYR